MSIITMPIAIAAMAILMIGAEIWLLPRPPKTSLLAINSDTFK
jgi:hypothetical protein